MDGPFAVGFAAAVNEGFDGWDGSCWAQSVRCSRCRILRSTHTSRTRAKVNDLPLDLINVLDTRQGIQNGVRGQLGRALLLQTRKATSPSRCERVLKAVLDDGRDPENPQGQFRQRRGMAMVARTYSRRSEKANSCQRPPGNRKFTRSRKWVILVLSLMVASLCCVVASRWCWCWCGIRDVMMWRGWRRDWRAEDDEVNDCELQQQQTRVGRIIPNT